MKYITIIIVAAMICISASVVSNTIFYPAKPKAYFSTVAYSGESAAMLGRNLFSKGWYNIKYVYINNNQSIIVTAEKY